MLARPDCESGSLDESSDVLSLDGRAGPWINLSGYVQYLWLTPRSCELARSSTEAPP